MQPATYAHFTLAKVRHDGWHPAPCQPASRRIKGGGNVRSFGARGAEQRFMFFFPLELRFRDSKSALLRIESPVPVFGGKQVTPSAFPRETTDRQVTTAWALSRLTQADGAGQGTPGADVTSTCFRQWCTVARFEPSRPLKEGRTVEMWLKRLHDSRWIGEGGCEILFWKPSALSGVLLNGECVLLPNELFFT